VSIYGVGDIQGCFAAFQSGLQQLKFNPAHDHIWAVGDLVNRGPQSLEVLQFFYDHQDCAKIVLGNHDLHAIARFYEIVPPHPSDTLEALLHPRYEYLIDWLRQQPLLYYHEESSHVMVHAGIAPWWNLAQAKQYAAEAQAAFSGPAFMDTLQHLYGNTPDHFTEALQGHDRIRFIVNAFTRMRYCKAGDLLDFSCKLPPDQAPQALYPWFRYPNRVTVPATLLFGHWASLKGETHLSRVIGLDTGCIWGGPLTFKKITES
jgi:bis(5'-nucleosyl)-tetraphosphatase (symmetrical)